jgi:hypothetical protein
MSGRTRPKPLASAADPLGNRLAAKAEKPKFVLGKPNRTR